MQGFAGWMLPRVAAVVSASFAAENSRIRETVDGFQHGAVIDVYRRSGSAVSRHFGGIINRRVVRAPQIFQRLEDGSLVVGDTMTAPNGFRPANGLAHLSPPVLWSSDK